MDNRIIFEIIEEYVDVEELIKRKYAYQLHAEHISKQFPDESQQENHDYGDIEGAIYRTNEKYLVIYLKNGNILFFEWHKHGILYLYDNVQLLMDFDTTNSSFNTLNCDNPDIFNHVAIAFSVIPEINLAVQAISEFIERSINAKGSSVIPQIMELSSLYCELNHNCYGLYCLTYLFRDLYNEAALVMATYATIEYSLGNINQNEAKRWYAFSMYHLDRYEEAGEILYAFFKDICITPNDKVYEPSPLEVFAKCKPDIILYDLKDFWLHWISLLNKAIGFLFWKKGDYKKAELYFYAARKCTSDINHEADLIRHILKKVSSGDKWINVKSQYAFLKEKINKTEYPLKSELFPVYRKVSNELADIKDLLSTLQRNPEFHLHDDIRGIFSTEYRLSLKLVTNKKSILKINGDSLDLSPNESDIFYLLAKRITEEYEEKISLGNLDFREIGWVSYASFRRHVRKWAEQLKKDEHGENIVSDSTIIKAVRRLTLKMRKLAEQPHSEADLIENGNEKYKAKTYRLRVHPTLISVED